MELNIASKGSKYLVQDKKARLLYTVKKKGFGTGQYNLMDASNYILYTLVQLTGDKKPSFSIIPPGFLVKVFWLSLFAAV